MSMCIQFCNNSMLTTYIVHVMLFSLLNFHNFTVEIFELCPQKQHFFYSVGNDKEFNRR